MTDLVEQRINIQQEEVSFEAAVSEGTFSRMGQAVNFINKRQFDSFKFDLNGPYYISGSINSADGGFFVPFDLKIIGISLRNAQAGTLGQTNVDFELFRGSGSSLGSILTVLPEIKAAAPNDSYVASINGTNYGVVAGETVAPVLSVTELNAGDFITMNLTDVMQGAEGLTAQVFYIPR